MKSHSLITFKLSPNEGQLPNLNEFMRISRRILAGLATASLAVT